MKIIALLPVKNEEWILPTYLHSIKKYADEIIVVNDNSTDKTKEILESFGAKVYDNTHIVKSGWAEYEIRKDLLRLGRESGGTHFIVLDADEVISESFNKEDIYKLQKGQKMSFRWSILWGNTWLERIDGVFNNLYKDFIFCDDGVSSYSYEFLGVSRCPKLSNNIKTLVSDSIVLHFQNYQLARNQIKQVWYKCSELINGLNVRKINNKYFFISDKVKTKPLQIENDILLPQETFDIEKDWHYKQILKWFNIYGITFFEGLQIWHIKELHDIFIEKTKREPKSKTFPKFLIKLNNIKNKVKNSL